MEADGQLSPIKMDPVQNMDVAKISPKISAYKV
jgi:hypothetical protein